MKKVRIAFALALLAGLSLHSTGTVQASCGRPDSPGVFAFETITVSSASIGFTSATYAPTGQTPAFAALVTIETNSVRFRSDGTAPTASVGHIVTANQTIEVCGTDNVKNFRMIRVGSDASATVSYFR